MTRNKLTDQRRKQLTAHAAEGYVIVYNVAELMHVRSVMEGELKEYAITCGGERGLLVTSQPDSRRSAAMAAETESWFRLRQLNHGHKETGRDDSATYLRALAQVVAV